jgi:hypothetical protein
LELQQLLLDSRGHVIAVSRVTAEHNGRRHHTARAARYSIVGDRIADIEVYEPGLDQANQFWA